MDADNPARGGTSQTLSADKVLQVITSSLGSLQQAPADELAVATADIASLVQQCLSAGSHWTVRLEALRTCKVLFANASRQGSPACTSAVSHAAQLAPAVAALAEDKLSQVRDLLPLSCSLT